MRYLASFALVLGCAVALPGQAAGSSCDRACLIGSLKAQVAGMQAHNAANLAPDFRYTENAVAVKPGEGLWRTLGKPGDFQRWYADPTTGDAAFFGVVEEAGSPAILSLRMRFAGGKATQAEAIIVRKGSHNFYSPEGLAKDGMSDAPLKSKSPQTRAQLMAAADSYFNGIQTQDPTVVLSTPDCVRVENGTKVSQYPGAPPSAAYTDKDCTANIPGMKQIAQVVNRRYLVDEAAGVVLGAVVFNRHPGAKRADGSPQLRLLVHEYFTVQDGRFAGIYAAMQNLPVESPGSGWQ